MPRQNRPLVNACPIYGMKTIPDGAWVSPTPGTKVWGYCSRTGRWRVTVRSPSTQDKSLSVPVAPPTLFFPPPTLNFLGVGLTLWPAGPASAPLSPPPPPIPIDLGPFGCAWLLFWLVIPLLLSLPVSLLLVLPKSACHVQPGLLVLPAFSPRVYNKKIVSTL